MRDLAQTQDNDVQICVSRTAPSVLLTLAALYVRSIFSEVSQRHARRPIKKGILMRVMVTKG